MSVTKLLTGHELFRSLRFEDVDRINSFSGLKDLDADAFVFERGMQGSHIYVLLEGQVHLRLPAGAHEASLGVGRIEKGEIFGLAPLLGAGRHLTSARCAEPCKVLAIEAAPLRELLEQEHAVGFHIMSMAAQAYFTRYVETLERVRKVINEIAVV